MSSVGLPGTGIGAEAATMPASLDWRARLPIYYGWLIVAGILTTMALTFSVWYCFSVFYVALLEEFGWSRGPSAGVFSLFVITNGLISPVAGALADRFGPGRVLAAGGVVMAAGLLACSQVTELWQFYLSYGVLCGMGVGISGWTPCVTMISRWFSGRLGLALGLASTGIGFGILLVVPFLQALISSAGWRTAFVALAAGVFVVLLPTGLLLIRGRPEDLGLQVDGLRSPSEAEANAGRAPRKRGLEVVDREWAGRSWTVAAALRTNRYWIMAVVKFVGNIALQTIFVHQVAYLVAQGHDKMLVASIVGLVGLLSAAAKLLWGWAADTLGREWTYSLGTASLVLAVGLLVATQQMAPSLILLYAYAVFFALGYGVSAPIWPLVAADLFKGPRFGSIYGSVGIFAGLGSALGVWFAGYVFDLTGDYTFAFLVAATGSAVSSVALWILAPRKVRRVRGRA